MSTCYVPVRREYPSGRVNTEWCAPDGRCLRSRPEAWRYYTSCLEAADAGYDDFVAAPARPPSPVAGTPSCALPPSGWDRPSERDAVPPESRLFAAEAPGGSQSVSDLADVIPYHERLPARPMPHRRGARS